MLTFLGKSRRPAAPEQSAVEEVSIADETIRLNLLSASVGFRNGREIYDAFRHRYLLAHYFAFTVKVLVLSYLLSLSDVAVGVLFPAIVIGFAAAFWGVAAYLWVAVHVRGIAKAQEPVRMRLEPGLVFGGLAMGLALAFVTSRIGAGHSGRMEPSLLSLLLPILYLLLAVAFLLRRPVPRALKRLRADPAGAAVIGVPLAVGLPEAEAGDDVQTGGDPAGDAAEQAATAGEGLEGSGDRAALAAVLRLEADGNYVTVVTERGRMSVPGPFAAVVARMPVGAGRQVHRSHWVARRAVTGDRRVGRDVRLQTVDGESVPVSAAQVAAVRAWLSQGGEERGHRKSREARTR